MARREKINGRGADPGPHNLGPHNWVAALRRFVREPAAVEHCELCGEPISADHSHLTEPASHRLLCACRSCAMMFANRADGRYRTVPGRTQVLPRFQMTDAQWDDLAVPIGMAFFFRSTADDRVVALYPGPAGATESQLSLTAWDELVAANPVLGQLEPDVEALLVNRIDGAREYYRLPIDQCYALVGLMRSHWRGLSGGEEAWAAIRHFFEGLRKHEQAPGIGAHA